MKYKALKNFIFESIYYSEGYIYDFDFLPSVLKDGYLEKIGSAEPTPPKAETDPEKPTEQAGPAIESETEDVDSVMQMPDLGSGEGKGKAKRK